MVVLQFGVSVALVIGALLINQQLNFIKNSDLGFQKEQQLVIPLRTETSRTNSVVFKQEILQLPQIRAVSGVASSPSQFILHDFSVHTEGEDMSDAKNAKVLYTDEDYLATLSIPILAGRDLRVSDTSNQIILNETALEKLDLSVTEAPGTRVYSNFDGEQVAFQIVGVMQDYNFQSLRQRYIP